MSTEVSMYRVAKIEVKSIRENDSYDVRSIIVTDEDGVTLEISLYANRIEDDETSSLEFRV